MTEDSTVPVFDFNGNPWLADDIAGMSTFCLQKNNQLFVYEKIIFLSFQFFLLSRVCLPSQKRSRFSSPCHSKPSRC